MLTWKDGRENPDNATVSVVYPKGILYAYSTTFSNSYRSFSRIRGRKGSIENHCGEGASLFIVIAFVLGPADEEIVDHPV